VQPKQGTLPVKPDVHTRYDVAQQTSVFSFVKNSFQKDLIRLRSML